MRRGVLIPLLLVAGLLAGTIRSRSEDPKREVPARSDCPRGDCCLWRLGLEAAGKLEYKLGRPHECPTGETASGSGTLDLELKSAGPPCDESAQLIPKGSRLKATGLHVVRRKDDVAHVCGAFTIVDGDKVVWSGEIELMHRVNTHHDPFGPDPCDRKDHLQGWLRGTRATEGVANGHLLRAMLVARTRPLEGDALGKAVGPAHIDGLILKCEQER
jgi:hypothetical protein